MLVSRQTGLPIGGIRIKSRKKIIRMISRKRQAIPGTRDFARGSCPLDLWVVDEVTIFSERGLVASSTPAYPKPSSNEALAGKNSCRNADGGTAGGHVRDDHRVGTDDGMFAQADAAQDASPGADIDVPD